jgi:hypothetical protein
MIWQQLSGVWENGGGSAKLSICTSINISGLLNICASTPPLRQAPQTLSVMQRSTAQKG